MSEGMGGKCMRCGKPEHQQGQKCLPEMATLVTQG